MGGERLTTTVTICTSRWGDDDWPPDTLTGTIEWLSSKLALIPDEHKGSAQCDIGTSSDYDPCLAEIEISYSRPWSNSRRNTAHHDYCCGTLGAI